MGYGALISELTARIRDWRRYAPAAGSAVAHVVVLLAVGAMMAVAPPRVSPPPRPSPPTIVVTLVDESVAPPIQRPPERRAAPAPRTATPSPRRRDDRRATTTPQPAEPSAPASGGITAEALPSSPTGVPLGLKKMLETNPCRELEDRIKRNDCNTVWSKLAEESSHGYSPTAERLAARYRQYRPDSPEVPLWASLLLALSHLDPEIVGAAPGGGQVMGARGMMPSGAASAGGPSDMVGRLGNPIPDPVFDADVPLWLGFDHPARLPAPKPRDQRGER